MMASVRSVTHSTHWWPTRLTSACGAGRRQHLDGQGGLRDWALLVPTPRLQAPRADEDSPPDDHRPDADEAMGFRAGADREDLAVPNRGEHVRGELSAGAHRVQPHEGRIKEGIQIVGLSGRVPEFA